MEPCQVLGWSGGSPSLPTQTRALVSVPMICWLCLYSAPIPLKLLFLLVLALLLLPELLHGRPPSYRRLAPRLGPG